MRTRERTVEEVVAALAEQSRGVVTRALLLAAGLTSDEIARRVRRGVLWPVYRGVYRVGHRAPSLDATYLAAVRACGPGALLAGRAAAHLLGLTKGRAPRPEVVAPADRRVPGVTCRRSRRVEPRDATNLRRIPVTTVARTLADLAARLPPEELARACHEAGVRYRITPAAVEAVLARRPTSPGARRLRAVLRGEVPVALSVLEARFLARLREVGLPLPETNRPVGGRRVDCRWPEQRLVVELDGYRYHHSRHAWEQDRRREREARARGDEFRRYSYGDVVEKPRFMLTELRALLPSAR